MIHPGLTQELKPTLGSKTSQLLPTAGEPGGPVRVPPNGGTQVSLLGKGIQGVLPRRGDLQAAPQRKKQDAQQKEDSRVYPAWVGKRQGQGTQ